MRRSLSAAPQTEPRGSRTSNAVRIGCITTGANNSPTLTKRELKTTVGLQDGDVIVLGGGLAENKDTQTRDGPSFLPSFLHTSGKDVSSSEILLVLQVQRL